MKTCTSYLHFRSKDPSYNTPVDIGYLLSADPRNISSLNSVLDVSLLPPDTDVIVPATCTCNKIKGHSLYQHNASYTIKYRGETYFRLANETFQGLSTCRAVIAQNPYTRYLVAGQTLRVPLRCACPSAAQRTAGFRYLLTYVITWGDTVSAVADRFNSTEKAVLEANTLNASQLIFPFTTLLIPLYSEPSNLNTSKSPSPAASPPPAASSGGHGARIIGVSAGAGVLVCLCSASLVWWMLRHRRRSGAATPVVKDQSRTKLSSSLISNTEIRSLMESLAVYKFEDLDKATESFDEQHRIKGSVYRGTINGDVVAIKQLKGDVAAEIGILKNINHSNVVRLSGICLHDQGNTYLVYEYAEMGSLADWLHGGGGGESFFLSWKQRVQIAYDVADGLNYVHNYTTPPYVHKDLKSSNILLDGQFRAKIANFGVARPVNAWESLRFTKHVVGTQGYMAPEYLEHGIVTTKLDVFAFGVVVLQLLSGKEAAIAGDEGRVEILLWQTIERIIGGDDARIKLEEFMDPKMKGEYSFEIAYRLAQLARRCVSRDPSSRPSMDEILVSLSTAYASTLDWDPSDVSS